MKLGIALIGPGTAFVVACAATEAPNCSELLAAVSQPHPEWGSEYPLQGEPGCERGCGYTYDRDMGELNFGWVHAPDLECPLDTSECLSLTEALNATQLECEADEDCILIDGIDNCENVFEPPVYIDSTRLSDGVRAEREELWAQIIARGCGGPTGLDGPVLEAGCIDGLCGLQTTGYCQAGPEEDDAGTGVNLEADASIGSESNLR